MITFHSLWTVLSLVVFVCLIFWAWGDKRKDEFDEAANYPLNDDIDQQEGKNNG